MTDNTNIKPFGDTIGDGYIQLSFTLPIAKSGKSTEAAKTLAAKMGLDEAYVAHEEEITPGFTFFIVYGKSIHSVNLDEIQATAVETEEMSFGEINDFIETHLGRPVRVVGACIETDAHTVGIDAILNMKGVAGDYGLERYEQFAVKNMGAQIKCESLIREALDFNADAILVSTIVTQKDIHIQHLTKLIDMLEAERIRDRFQLIVGGPRISNALARELGYDAGFGRETLPSQVAAFLAKRQKEIGEKQKNQQGKQGGF